MTVTTLVIGSFGFLVVMGFILGLRKPASYSSDTTMGRGGISYHRDKNVYTRNN